jgi:hypothetical protein
MKKLVLALFVTMAVNAFAADTVVKGYLVDTACQQEDGNKPGFGAEHTKACLRMKECVSSGYGVLTEDKKYIKFDTAGNSEARKFIDALKKTSDIRVAVTGSVDGSKMTVTKIELQ